MAYHVLYTARNLPTMSMTAKPMPFQISDLGNNVYTALAGLVAVATTYFATKSKFNKDKVESADATGKVDAIVIYKAMVGDRDATIEKLQQRNEELYQRNMELFDANQKAISEIGTMKLQIKQLEQQVKELNAQIGRRRKDDPPSTN